MDMCDYQSLQYMQIARCLDTRMFSNAIFVKLQSNKYFLLVPSIGSNFLFHEVSFYWKLVLLIETKIYFAGYLPLLLFDNLITILVRVGSLIQCYSTRLET